MRVVHYLNQFFGGLGGEDKAGAPLEVREGAVGPGLLLEQLLGGDAKVVMTLVCGDNYAVEKQEAMIDAALEKIREVKPDLFVAGPCFQAGRYGMAAGALCAAVQSKLGIPVVTGMSEENPGVDLYREKLYIIDSGTNAAQNARRPRQDGKLGDEVRARGRRRRRTRGSARSGSPRTTGPR